MGGCTSTNSNFLQRVKNLHSAYLKIISNLKTCIESLEFYFSDRKFTCNLNNFSEYLQKKLSKVQDEIVLKQIYAVLNEIKTLRSKLTVLFEINEQLEEQLEKYQSKNSSASNEQLYNDIMQAKNSSIILYNSLDTPDICFEDAKTLILSAEEFY